LNNRTILLLQEKDEKMRLQDDFIPWKRGVSL